MHKRKFILGLLIILAMAICGVWLTDTRPLVFAVETPNALVETVIDDAGTFSGKGFYVKGETANLKAEMNLGYEFDGWYNGDTLLSANVEHSFTVESDIEITYKWHRIEYSVDFADNDYFDITINNNTEAGNIYYYNNQLQITITTKPNLYVYDLTSEDISLNGISIADWISGTNSMSIGYVSHNNNNEGFKSYTFNLTIKEDVTIDVAYTKMFKLTIVSGNRIDIDNVINFLTINSYYSKLNNTNYLVRAGQSVNIILSSGNSVYHLHSAGIPSEVANMNQNRFYTLTEDTTFTVTYVKQGYNVSFTPYLINLYDNIDPMISPLLYGEISDVRLTAGDSVEFAYDAGSRAITIAGSEYTYNPTIYGYKFVKFEVDGVDKGVNGTYTLSDSEPTDVEIKLIFEYIEYTDVSIALVDNFFTGNYKTTITYSNSKLITGTDVSISALIENKFIDSRVIKGWSAINTPIIDADYLKMANTDATSDTYTFTFEPTSDDENISITIYLDIDYKYYSSTYSLSTRSITITEVVYDQIVIDKQNNKITFVDTANEDNNAEEVVADASASQIISTNLGELVIIGDELKYIKDGIEIKSTSKSTEGDIDVYSFTKNTYYTYWGELETGVVEYIKLVENGEDIKVELYGNKYSLALYTTDVILQEFETTRTLLREDIYTINAIDTGYTMLYKSGEYLELNGVKYKYDSSNSCYKLEASTGTNKPINVSAGIIQNDDEYNITLNNLMADSIIIYSTMSKNSGKYAFTHFVDQTSSTLGSFNYGEHYYTIQKGTMVEVKSSFKQLDGSITLIINDLNAYVYENISISVKHGGTTSGTTGNSITAQDGDLITIIINEEDISLGYEFVDYVFNGGVLSRDGYTCEFTMIMATYQNGTININFKPIDYIVNINVTRVDSNTTEENTGVKLQGGNFTSQVIVNISHLYTFVAETITGYYVDIANINEEYGITDLLRDNSSGDILTTWTLNSTNFIEAIINNANEDKEVNLNVGFTIHTYSVTVYYKLSNHKDSVSYPSIKIGGTETNPIAPTGEGNYYHYVVADGFEYGGDVVLQSSNYMVGLRRVSWQDALERELLQSDNYTILSIKSDIRLYLYLEFIYYEWDIEIINPSEANSNGYSNNVPKPRNACYKDRVTFNINPDAVSVLSNIQYIDASGVATPFDLPNGDLVFEFIPANFKIQDGKIKIVFTFTLKMFNFSISNNISSADLKASYFTEKNGYNQDNIVEYSLKVTRDGNNNSLEAIEGKYNVQALDKIYIYIYPVSVGIHVNSINLGGIVFSTLSGNNDYKLMQYNDGPKDKPIYYLCIVEFNSAVMQQLRYTVDAGTKSISIDIVNNMVLRTYTINYTCNYIETFSIKLRYKRMWGALSNITIIGSEKNSLTIPDNNAGQALAKKPIIFSSTIEFSYESGADASAYDVYGFNIAGKEYNGISKFEFNDINLWTNIAIAQLEAPSTITITLILRPKVVLNNYKSNDGYYLYETDSLNNRIKNTTYNGEYQSLNIGVTSSYDIQVDSAFTVVVMYSNNGSSYDLHEIKDVGEYWAKITIQLNGGVVITFGEEIRYHILPVTLGVRLGSYKDTNPLTQVYDGTNQLTQESLTNLLKDIVFTGIVESDQALNIRIRSEGVNATFENSIVNTRGLYEVTLMNVILVDGSNLLLQNYKLPNTTIVFKNIGQINPRPIDILGFTPQNKVYDGTNEVVANVENIVFIGKIDGDATEILTENLKFYIDNYSVGRNREVLIDWSNALDGADKNNYTIQYNKTYIDIYPYQLECEIEGYGVFKIVDESRLCLIPIDATLYARAFEKGSREYESVYMAVERSVSDTERLIRGYQLIMQVNTLSIQLPEGVFVYLPKTNKVTKVMQIVANDSSVKLERFNNNEFIVVKIVKGNAVFGVVAKTSYLPLWAIVLIVIGSLAVIGGIVVVVIIIRRKVKGKYSRYDRI